MDAINSISPRQTSLPDLGMEGVSGPSPLQSRLQEISLKIIGPVGQIEGPGGEIRIQLDHPLIGPEDIPLNEFLQQLQSLGQTPLPVFTLGEAVHQLSEGSRALADEILRSKPDGEPADLRQLIGEEVAQRAVTPARGVVVAAG